MIFRQYLFDEIRHEKKDFKEVLAREGTYLTNSFEEAADTEGCIHVASSNRFLKGTQ